MFKNKGRFTKYLDLISLINIFHNIHAQQQHVVIHISLILGKVMSSVSNYKVVMNWFPWQKILDKSADYQIN